MMETKSINSPNIDVRQKLNFMDSSFDNDSDKNNEIRETHEVADQYNNDEESSKVEEVDQNHTLGM